MGSLFGGGKVNPPPPTPMPDPGDFAKQTQAQTDARKRAAERGRASSILDNNGVGTGMGVPGPTGVDTNIPTTPTGSILGKPQIKVAA